MATVEKIEINVLGLVGESQDNVTWLPVTVYTNSFPVHFGLQLSSVWREIDEGQKLTVSLYDNNGALVRQSEEEFIDDGTYCGVLLRGVLQAANAVEIVISIDDVEYDRRRLEVLFGNKMPRFKRS